MSPAENEGRIGAASEVAEEEVVSRAGEKRDWLGLGLAHLKVAVSCPALAATIFWLLGPDRDALLDLKGIFAFLVTVGCTYLFFGMFSLMAVLMITPVVWAVSKIPAALAGRCVALAVGAGLAWLVCEFTVNDMPAFQIALAATAALAAAALENAWRRTSGAGGIN